MLLALRYFLLFILLMPFSLCVQADEDGVALLKKIDELFRSNTSIATMKMTITTPNWQRTLEMQSWTQGMEDTFIRVLSPRKDRGVATLKKDKEMWNFFPKINKVIKVPPSMMMGSWMGSDFTNDDLVREVSLVEEYHVSKTELDDTYQLILLPKQSTVTVWGKITIVVNKADLLPLEQNYFNEKGEKIRAMTFSQVRDFSGKKMPAIMTMVPLNKSGHKTVIEYVDAKFDSKLKENIFTLRNLQTRF
ncbi:outer membrane lipoprotein-sorting protein [Litorilituus lipolyticus]|uniref:Outer membrane lipoprotein-sorting protein n=1 Tax=Litorilituus lipolyticus TaxID=2491017 RepID=A0A502KUE4_9GAMM|nr:outer membrane lipoprotein-sorting protein [Litorilituus lipolyticus]TPH13243.1 outer membrane lipoprotein-sorting protein [Litorilituus lipolyticus]